MCDNVMILFVFLIICVQVGLLIRGWASLVLIHLVVGGVPAQGSAA